MSLRIAFFGSSLVSAYWNGAATYYRGILGALASRGHDITFFEPDAYDRQRNRDIDDPAWARVVVYPGDDERAAMAALEHARGADVVVKASGVGVYDELLEREVLNLRDADTRVIFWDVDAPATLERIGADRSDPFRELIPRYDLVFTYGGGPPVVSGYEACGARECVPVYNALDPLTHHPVAPDSRFAADLVFLGNRLPDREGRVEEFFLRPAALLPQKKFLLGGNGWEDKPVPINVQRVGHVFTHDHNAANCSATAVLNVNRDSMARFGHSPPTRVFEAAGAGACLITDRWNGLEEFLEPGTEVLVADSGDEVAALMTEVTGERANVIGAAARRRVLAHHTYQQRADLVESVLGVAVVGSAQ
jgi:spore maturation protein CgeB